jgi:FHA domain-containing protein/zinc ribbon family protein
VSKYVTGTLAGAGSFRCATCGFHVALHALDEVPECPNCGEAEFARASLFDEDTVASSGLHVDEQPAWLSQIHDGLEDGQYLAYEDTDGVALMPLTQEWTRIGRSLAADIRLDDPTVSRRHALLCRQDGSTRVLDDRSLNGIFVNGERVEWADLDDGAEVIIGRYRLFYVDGGEPTRRSDRPADDLVSAG